MNKFKLLLITFLPFLISCQSNNLPLPTHTESNNNLLLDNAFTVSSTFHLETEQEIFKLDDEMLFMVKEKLLNGHTARYKARLLLEHIFDEENISLKYDGNANVTASQAYHSQTANCMSLTIMAYALAREAGLNISFQQVLIPEYWVRNGNYNMLTGHVNLVVREHSAVERNIVWGAKSTQIDFDPFVAKEHFPKKIIEMNTVLAMFFNNKGAEALVSKEYSIAYQYFKAAINQDKKFSSAWGNLGVLYRFTGYDNAAEKVYRHSLMLQKNNLTALSNLSILLKAQNEQMEAKRIDEYLHQIRRSNPYYYAVLADEAFYQASYKEAESLYKKAIQLDDQRHEFYFGLAKVYYKQQKFNAAKRFIKKAMQYNAVRSIDQQYIAKLNVLNNTRTNVID